MTELYTKLQSKFEKACEDNSVQIVKHLLETTSLRKHINLHNKVINVAFKNHSFELVDYLLAQPDFNSSHKVEIISEAFATACIRSDLVLIKILFNEQKYKNHLSVFFNNTWCFRTSFSNKRKEILNFLILEAGIEKKNPDVHREMYMIFPKNEEMIKHCESLFLQKKLSLELNNSNKNKKNKFKV